MSATDNATASVKWPPTVGATIHSNVSSPHFAWEGEVRTIVDDRVAVVRLTRGYVNGNHAEDGYVLLTPSYVLVFGRNPGGLAYGKLAIDGPIPRRHEGD